MKKNISLPLPPCQLFFYFFLFFFTFFLFFFLVSFFSYFVLFIFSFYLFCLFFLVCSSFCLTFSLILSYFLLFDFSVSFLLLTRILIYFDDLKLRKEYEDFNTQEFVKNLKIVHSTLCHWIKKFESTRDIKVIGSRNYRSDAEKKKMPTWSGELRGCQKCFRNIKKNNRYFGRLKNTIYPAVKKHRRNSKEHGT